MTRDPSTDVCKAGHDIGREAAEVSEGLGQKPVNRRERVSHRSGGTGGFNQAFLGADDLRRRNKTGESTAGPQEDRREVEGRTSERGQVESAL